VAGDNDKPAWGVGVLPYPEGLAEAQKFDVCRQLLQAAPVPGIAVQQADVDVLDPLRSAGCVQLGHTGKSGGQVEALYRLRHTPRLLPGSAIRE
jgi:hypothetical protein